MKRLNPVAVSVVAAASAVAVLGVAATKSSAADSHAARAYTLRVGDSVNIPSVGQKCTVYVEGGAPELFCARPRGAHHQVTFFRDAIHVWRVGDPDHTAWSGTP